MALVSYKRKVILAKLEVTYGTDSAPVAATDGVLSMNLSLDLAADDLERELDHPYLAANPSVLVGRMATVEFDFEPVGHATLGTAAPSNAIMEACAHAGVSVASTSFTYNPISSAAKSATIHFYMGDQRVAITGCRGTIDFENEIKKFPKAHVKLVGQFAIPTTQAIVSPVVTTWQDPPAIETETWSLTVNSIAVCATMFQLSQGNEVPMHECSEQREVVLTDRKANGKLRIYDPTVGVLDLWTLAKDRTQVPIVSIVNGGANKITTINVPKAQLSLPKFVEIEGVIGLEFDFKALVNSASGNDEYTVAYT